MSYIFLKKDTKKFNSFASAGGFVLTKGIQPCYGPEICKGRIGLLCSMSEARLTKISPLSCLLYTQVAFKPQS
jgi:hypothetical protein